MNCIRFIYVLCLALSCKILSQTTGSRTVSFTLPVVILMDVEPSGAITLNFTAPTEAGRALIVPSANTSKWINYTSAIAPGGLSRRITVSVNQTYPGVDIKAQAAASATGEGTLGTSSGQITLSTTAQTLISGIGGAYTGSGTNSGHRITITLSTNTYANLTAGTGLPIVITYTITE